MEESAESVIRAALLSTFWIWSVRRCWPEYQTSAPYNMMGHVMAITSRLVFGIVSWFWLLSRLIVLRVFRASCSRRLTCGPNVSLGSKRTPSHRMEVVDGVTVIPPGRKTGKVISCVRDRVKCMASLFEGSQVSAYSWASSNARAPILRSMRELIAVVADWAMMPPIIDIGQGAAWELLPELLK